MDSSAETVDFLVDFRTMMVTLLTGTGYSESHTTWMPCTDTSDLTQTLVSLTGQFLGVPTCGNTFESLALGDGNAIDHLVLSEDLIDWNGLLQMFLDPVDLVFDSSTIELDLHDVSFLLALLDQADLCFKSKGKNVRN